MISCSISRGSPYDPISNFECISTDIPDLPINSKKNKFEFRITNGSVAFVMDTGQVFKFDEENDRWLEI